MTTKTLTEWTQLANDKGWQRQIGGGARLSVCRFGSQWIWLLAYPGRTERGPAPYTCSLEWDAETAKRAADAYVESLLNPASPHVEPIPTEEN